MIKFSFEELKLERIYGWCIAENLASARVMEKVGMRFEERFTENEWFKGRWCERYFDFWNFKR